MSSLIQILQANFSTYKVSSGSLSSTYATEDNKDRRNSLYEQLFEKATFTDLDKSNQNGSF